MRRSTRTTRSASSTATATTSATSARSSASIAISTSCGAGADEHRVDWVAICSPNYLHDAHIRLALRNGANALCEKPIVINPWNLDALQQLEIETGRRVFTVLQLRVHPQLIALRERLRARTPARRAQVSLVYITSRGPWYQVSWKGSEEKSGGIGTNIGVHLFDLLIWLFGKPAHSTLSVNEPRRMGGRARARAGRRQVVPVDEPRRSAGGRPGAAARPRIALITIDGEPVEFSEGFTDLHTEVYRRTLQGEGFGIEDARASIELVSAIRSSGAT